MKTIAAFFGFLFMICGVAEAAEVTQPNIVVVLADQWRAQAFGFAGDPNAKTPNFDRLAGESVRFINAVAGMPVCSPTRASLLTGQRPLTHGVFLNDVPLSPDANTLPKVLKAAGYDTGAIGKWHIDGQGRSAFIPRERRQGFDYWKMLECTHNYTNSIYYGDTAEKLHWSGYDSLDQTRDACDFLRARAKAEKPFLLWLAWGPPHDPYLTAPAKYRALYDPAKLALRPNIPAHLEAQARKNLAGYYAHCSALDDAMGELLTTLRETGLAENTIVVFSADHGDMLGSQGLWKKQKPFDESARVPLLIRWPAALGNEARQLDAPINRRRHAHAARPRRRARARERRGSRFQRSPARRHDAWRRRHRAHLRGPFRRIRSPRRRQGIPRPAHCAAHLRPRPRRPVAPV